MKTLECPANITLLLHYHCRPEPPENHEAPVIISYTKQLLDGGVIERFGDGYTTTPLGRAWVELLCNTPKPTVAFVDQNGKVIKT